MKFRRVCRYTEFSGLADARPFVLAKIKTAVNFDMNEKRAKEFLKSNNIDVSPTDILVPGLCDVHVHFREPGFEYKETVKSGSEAAAAGGYTAVCTMPNLNPVPDCPKNLNVQLSAIKRDAVINVIPYGAITVGERGEALSEMKKTAAEVCAFSDDGKGIQDAEIMRRAMSTAAELGMIIAAHCEDNSLLNGGYIHSGAYAAAHGHRGIPSESEYVQIERDLNLAAATGCAYHVCHISAKESVNIIREAKRSGIDVTCETAPHYLVLSEDDLKEDGRFKMNPPLRSVLDKEALLEGIQDGAIDMIATDHAPHSAEEKSGGLEKSLMGVVGLETAFPILYTNLANRGVISVSRLIELMSSNPRKRFNITSDIGFSVFDVENPYIIDPERFKTKGRATPFEGARVLGRCKATVYNGRIVYRG